MSEIQTKLLQLLEVELIVELEDYIDELFEMINKNKNATDEEKDELASLQELYTELKELVDEINNGEVDDEEAEEIYAELMEMKNEEE